MSDHKPTTTIQNLHEITDEDLYITHDSEHYKFEITKKAFKQLSKSEQNKLKKLAARNFVIERK